MINGKEASKMAYQAVEKAKQVKAQQVMSPKDEKDLEEILQKVKQAAFEGYTQIYVSMVSDALENKLNELGFYPYSYTSSGKTQLSWDYKEQPDSKNLPKTRESMKALAEQNLEKSIEKELNKVLEDIDKSARNGYFSLVTAKLRPGVQEKLEELGFQVKFQGYDHSLVKWD